MNFRFEEFVLCDDSHRLLRADEEVHLSPKAFAVLRALLRNAPRALGKSELLALAVPGTFIAEGGLAIVVNELRTALGDDARRPRFIKTVHTLGYAFLPPVERVHALDTTASPNEACYWLVYGNQSLGLRTGENVVGRQPGCDVVLDAPGISRRHAKITIEADQVLLEDLDSKNGSFVGGQRIGAPTRLRHGDRIQLGSACLQFSISSAQQGTETFQVGRRAPTASNRLHSGR